LAGVSTSKAVSICAILAVLFPLVANFGEISKRVVKQELSGSDVYVVGVVVAILGAALYFLFR
jgi:hypothetical protein